METVREFIFGDSKITADGECSHEIKTHLLLGRKAMTNLHSILKSRDITLPTKVFLVKAVFFPVVTYGCGSSVQFSSVQSLSCVRLFATPWTAACQASLSITSSRSLLELMSIESVLPCNRLIPCRPLLFLPSIFPASGSFPMSQFCASRGQNIGVSIQHQSFQ